MDDHASSTASASSDPIVIVGAGIVGSALAYYLSTSPKLRAPIILLDRSFSPLLGSTGHAPGFVGQYNETEVLSRLAIDTVREYVKIPNGFDVVGGLEVATSEQGIAMLKKRCEMASSIGLPANLISAEDAVKLVPEILKAEDVSSALHFPSDGTAAAGKITAFYQDEARKAGAQLIQADVTGIESVDGQVTGVASTAGNIKAGTVLVATGIWTASLLNLDIPIPIIPVGHPYVYGRPQQAASNKTPWVRWPEHHVYARDHGELYGVGSYNHHPVCVEPQDSAIGNWIEGFDSTLAEAQSFLANRTRLVFENKFNGIFSMTPDNLPLVGTVPSVKGLYLAAAVWVTHAAGSARFLTQLLEGGPLDEEIRRALDPARFKGKDWKQLKQTSLNGYNDIYTTGDT